MERCPPRHQVARTCSGRDSQPGPGRQAGPRRQASSANRDPAGSQLPRRALTCPDGRTSDDLHRLHRIPVNGLRGVGPRGYCPGSAGGEVPGQVAGLGLAELPAGCLLGRVMPSAQRGQIAFAGAPALVIRHRVVIVAPPGGPPAAREAAGPVPGLDQVPQHGRGLVGEGLPGMAAGPGLQPPDRDPGQPFARVAAGSGWSGPGAGAAMPDGLAAGAGDRQAPPVAGPAGQATGTHVALVGTLPAEQRQDYLTSGSPDVKA